MAKPMCPYFGKCGGCSAQHIDYALQLENKQGQLSRSINIPASDIKIFSDKEYEYRNRMDFIFHPSGLGFREKGKWWKTVDIEKCPISDPKINVLLKELREFFRDIDSFDIKKHAGTYRYAVIRTPQEDSSISFVLNEDSKKIAGAIDKIKEFSQKTTAKNIIVTYVPSSTDMSISSEYFVVKGREFLEERYLDKKFKYSIQGFFQNNHEMAEKMVGYAKELLSKYDTSKTSLLDLYGGVGGFGIVCSDLFEKILIVEGDKNCIAAAEKNLKLNEVKNGEAILLDATKIKKLDLPSELFVITDPPRSGMHPKTVKRLNESGAKVIIYVSCNVRQLAKELPAMKNYSIKSAAMFDLFPQTPHSEAVIELVKKVDN